MNNYHYAQNPRVNKKTLSKFLKFLRLSRVWKYNLFVAAKILHNGNLPFWRAHRGYIRLIVSNLLLDAGPRYFFVLERACLKTFFPDLVPQIFIPFPAFLKLLYPSYSPELNSPKHVFGVLPFYGIEIPTIEKTFRSFDIICQDFRKYYSQLAYRKFRIVKPQSKCFIIGCTLISSDYYNMYGSSTLLTKFTLRTFLTSMVLA